jgi:leader peptidase (prepilin peptidase)/N-methyltransferase
VGIFLLTEGIRDYKKHKISMLSVLLFAVLGIVLEIPEAMTVWKEMVAGVMVGAVVLILAKITEGKIGFGDGWVLMVTGLYLGFRGNLFLFMAALFVSAVISIILLLCRRATKKTELPFVSFLFIGYILTITI